MVRLNLLLLAGVLLALAGQCLSGRQHVRPAVFAAALKLDSEADSLRLNSRGLMSKGKLSNQQRWMEQHADGGLAPKPEDAGPDSPVWRNSIAICSMIKDENSTDVREWVMYYR